MGAGVGADFTGIGVAVPPGVLELGTLATLPGGLPRFLAGWEARLVSSAFLLLFIMPGLGPTGAGGALFFVLSLFSSFSPPDFEVCDVVSSSEELSESELSESELLELLDSILLVRFFTLFVSSGFLTESVAGAALTGGAGAAAGALLGVVVEALPGAFLT